IRGRVRGLHDEHVTAADVLVDADRDFAVLELRDLGFAERHLELLADRGGQAVAGVAREDTTRIQARISRWVRSHPAVTRSHAPGRGKEHDPCARPAWGAGRALDSHSGSAPNRP